MSLAYVVACGRKLTVPHGGPSGTLSVPSMLSERASWTSASASRYAFSASSAAALDASRTSRSSRKRRSMALVASGMISISATKTCLSTLICVEDALFAVGQLGAPAREDEVRLLASDLTIGALYCSPHGGVGAMRQRAICVADLAVPVAHRVSH